MRKVIRPAACALLSLALLLGLCATSFAAEKVYSLNMLFDGIDWTLEVQRGGETVCGYPVEKGKIALNLDGQGDLIVRFVDDAEEMRRISLGGQREITVGGDIRELLLERSLKKEVQVTVAEESNIEEMSTSSRAPLTVDGSVDKLYIREDARVALGEMARVTVLHVSNKDARVTAEEGAYVVTARTVSKAAVSSVRANTEARIILEDDPADSSSDDDDDDDD